jgi:hypothetical protein
MPTASFQGVDNCSAMASLANSSPAAVCRGTNRDPKPLQTNLCRGFIKDRTCSALTGLEKLAPGMSAQRARQPPFVRVAAPLPPGLSLRMQSCTPKGGCRSLDLLPKHEKMCLDKSAPTFRVRALHWFFLVPSGKGAGRHEQPGGNGATRSGHDSNAPAQPEPFRRSRNSAQIKKTPQRGVDGLCQELVSFLGREPNRVAFLFLIPAKPDKKMREEL